MSYPASAATRTNRTHCRRGGVSVVMAVVMTAAPVTATWMLRQLVSFRREQDARLYLEREIHPSSIGKGKWRTAFVLGPANPAPSWSLTELLLFGRAYVPVTVANVGGVGGMTIPVDAGSWSALEAFRYLEGMKFVGCSIDAFIDADFSVFPNLGDLLIADSPFLSRHIATLAKVPRLRYVTLMQEVELDTWLPFIAQCRSLQSLELEGHCTDKAVASLISLKNLRYLSLGVEGLTPSIIPALIQLDNLDALVLPTLGLGDEDLRRLSELNKLRLLSLGGEACISYKGLQSLVKLTSLENLGLHYMNISSESATVLSQIKTLKELLLSYSDFDDLGLRQLTALHGLEVLVCSETRIGDVGVDLNFPALSYLDVSGTNLSDTGLRHLSHSPQLRVINISRTCVTEESINTLSSMGSLVTVLAYDTDIDQGSPEWKELLRQLEERRLHKERPQARQALRSLRLPNPWVQRRIFHNLMITPNRYHPRDREVFELFNRAWIEINLDPEVPR